MLISDWGSDVGSSDLAEFEVGESSQAKHADTAGQHFDARDSIVGVGVRWWPALREGFALARAQHVHAEVAVERLQARGQGLGKRLRRGSCIESAGVRGRAQALDRKSTRLHSSH